MGSCIKFAESDPIGRALRLRAYPWRSDVFGRRLCPNDGAFPMGANSGNIRAPPPPPLYNEKNDHFCCRGVAGAFLHSEPYRRQNVFFIAKRSARRYAVLGSGFPAGRVRCYRRRRCGGRQSAGSVCSRRLRTRTFALRLEAAIATPSCSAMLPTFPYRSVSSGKASQVDQHQRSTSFRPPQCLPVHPPRP